MTAATTRTANDAERFVVQSAVRAMQPRRGVRLGRLLRAAVEAIAAAPRAVPPEFFRHPFP